MRLIDADNIRIPNDERYIGTLRRLIMQQPTIDAVEVVRCEKCHYWKEAKVNKKGFLICPASGMEITEDDFCSYGERRKEDANLR